MKKILVFILFAGIISCTQAPKKGDTNPSFYGEFLYYADAAVLNTGNEIYGVVIDESMHKLNELCATVKRDEYDMIPVYIKGEVLDNPNKDGWEKLIKISSIDSLVNPNDNSIIKPN